MKTLEVKLFGKPRVFFQGQMVALSLKKSEALLYYLACEQRANRDELVGRIWMDVEAQVAKKNLRNSLYRIKKDLGIDVFSSPSKNVIALNESLAFWCDYHEDEGYFLKHYEGKLLEGFVLKGADDFEVWRQDAEESLNRKYRQLVISCFDETLKNDWPLAFQMASTLAAIDPFDELATRLLMRVYKEKNMYKQLVETYAALKVLLDEEMGIKPDSETRTLYYHLIQSRVKDGAKAEGLFGRQGEQGMIKLALSRSESVVVEGEAGVGKTKLLSTCLEQVEDGLEVIWTNCYLVEEGFAYKAWNQILGTLVERMRQKGIGFPEGVSQVLSKVFPSVLPEGEALYLEKVETIRSDYLEKLISKLLSDFTKHQRLVLAFDDLQWMDEWSLKLLQSVLLHVKGISFMASVRKSHSDKLGPFFTHLNKYHPTQTIARERFTKEETYAFLNEMLESEMSDDEKKKIYMASEGNAFFVVEYAGFFHRNDSKALYRLKNLMDARLMEVSKESQKVLGMMAMFFDETDYDMLIQLYAKSSDRLIEVVEELKSKDFIFEQVVDDAIKWRFTHHKLREHVYEKMPEMTRRVLHGKVAELLESQIKGRGRDVLLYQKLMYHYEGAKNRSKQLKYTLAYLKTYFDFSHELYPEGQMNVEIELDGSPEYYFDKLGSLFESAEDELAPEVASQYWYMKARYLIRAGDYDLGLKALESLKGLCATLGDDEMLFKALVQTLYYHIQTEQASAMAPVLAQMDGLQKSAKQEAMLYRLKGIERLMNGHFESARTYFMHSIEGYFALSEERVYALNIAAAYNYISETYLRTHAFEKALEYVNKAIDYARSHGIMRGRSVFNTSAGIIAYEMGHVESAKGYFEEALRCFEVVDSFWKKSEAEGYLGMILMEAGETERGARLLKRAKARALKINTPKTISLIESLEKQAMNVYDVNIR